MNLNGRLYHKESQAEEHKCLLSLQERTELSVKLLVILCVPFTAQHARPGVSPGSDKQSNGWDGFKPTAATVKPNDTSSTSVLPSRSISGLDPSSPSPSSPTQAFPSRHSLCPWHGNINVGKRRRLLAQPTPWHRVA